MARLNKYKLGFDKWGLILFLVIMIPNIIWFLVPNPNDILREESVVKWLDLVASLAQVVLIFSICFLIPVKHNTPISKWIRAGLVGLLLLYYIGWIAYFSGIVNLPVVLILSLAPSLALLLFAFGRKNQIACLAAIVFLISHTASSLINLLS